MMKRADQSRDRYGDLCQMSRPTKEQRLQVKSLVYRLAKYYDCTIGYDWQRNYWYESGLPPPPTHIAYMSFIRIHPDEVIPATNKKQYYSSCFFQLLSVYCYGGKDKFKVWKTFLDEYMLFCQGKDCKHFCFYRSGLPEFESMLLRCSSYEELDLKLSVAGFPAQD